MGHYDSCYEADGLLKGERRRKDLIRWVSEEFDTIEIEKLEFLHKISNFNDTELKILGNFINQIIKGK